LTRDIRRKNRSFPKNSRKKRQKNRQAEGSCLIGEKQKIYLMKGRGKLSDRRKTEDLFDERQREAV
jgi:hypothetical protein